MAGKPTNRVGSPCSASNGDYMRCPNCQHENRESAKFCEACATPLTRACITCGAGLRPTAKFCDECGAPSAPPATREMQSPVPVRQERTPLAYTPKHLADKILQSKSALEGERKQLTVLFADIKGSMDLAAGLDAEAWHEILDRFFALLTDCVHRYEGTVNQYTGDGIMALFGAPIAHEDHAQRACYAAIDMRERLREYADRLRLERGIDFGVRIGLNSGEVVVGRIGDDLRMDYTAQGQTVGLAQRIEQLAGADRVCLSEHTERLVVGYFHLRALGPAALIGNGQPVQIYELEGASTLRTRLEVARARGLSRFVGRDAEMRILETALARARDGHGQVVGVVGDPGLGKSRLCLEFAARCRAQGLPVYEAHCPAHGRNIPLLPMLELFRNYFGVKPEDSVEESRRKIAGTLTLLDPALQDGLPLLFEFLGVSAADAPALGDAELRQRQLVALLHRLFRAHNEHDRTGVIVIDDLHWVDPASDALVAQLVAATAGNRSLLLLNFRPEYVADWMHAPHYHRLPLVSLSDGELCALVTNLVGADVSLGELAERIVTWTDGNPFFAEEVLHSLIETGDLVGQPGAYRLARTLGALTAPASVRGVLAARIDRLPDEAKRLLQTAAVIGKELGLPLLAAVDGLTESARTAALARLLAGDFVFESALYPVSIYTFKHPLTHEVAYDSLLRQRREALHGAVATAIAAQEPARLDEHAALIAHHWERRADPSEAARWHERAAIWLGPREQAAATRHWQQVHDLLATAPSSSETDARRALACATLVQFAIRVAPAGYSPDALFAEGLRYAASAGRADLTMLLHGGYGMYRGVRLGEAEVYRQHGLEGVRIAATSGNPELQYIAAIFQQFGTLFSGRFAECVAIGEAMIALSGGDPARGARWVPQSPLITFHGANVLAQLKLGLPAAVVAGVAEMDRLHAIFGWNEAMIADDIAASVLAGWRGDIDQQLQHAHRAVDFGESSGHPFFFVFSHALLGEAFLARGDPTLALHHLDTATRSTHELTRIGAFHGAIHGQRALALWELGRADEAFEVARNAIAFCAPRLLHFDLQPWLSLAFLAIRRGAAPVALHTLAECAQLIDDTGARSYAPRLHALRADYAQTFGNGWDAEAELEATHHAAHALGMRAEGIKGSDSMARSSLDRP